jgi:membrane-associated phospholipid phosphatase
MTDPGNADAAQPAGWSIAPRAYAVVVGSGGALVCLAVLASRPKPNRLDVAITSRLQRRLPDEVGRALRIISSAGYAPFTHSVVLSLAANFWALDRRREAIFSIGTMGAGFTTGVIKLLVGRPRPDLRFRKHLKPFKDNSFPSGHATHYTAFYGYIFFLAGRYMPESPLRTALMLYCLLLIGLVGPSRIYLGHHWASDVLAGHLVGLAYLASMLQAYEAICVLMRPTCD